MNFFAKACSSRLFILIFVFYVNEYQSIFIDLMFINIEIANSEKNDHNLYENIKRLFLEESSIDQDEFSFDI